MGNLNDLLARQARQAGQPFEVEVEDKHLARALPQELRVFEKNFRFTPVAHDPFPKPEPKARKKEA